MAGVRVDLLLVVLTGTLLLVSVWAWEPLNDSQLFKLYETEDWVEPGFTSLDEGSDEEDEAPQVEGVATVNFDPHPQNGFEMVAEPVHLATMFDGGYQVEFVDTLPRSWSGSTSQSSDLNVVCDEFGFEIDLPQCPLSEVKVLGSKDLLPVLEAEESCGYEVNHLKGTLKIPFTGCHVNLIANCNASIYTVQLLYRDEFGQTQIATASCEDGKGPFPRANKPRKCIHPTKAPTTDPITTTQPSRPHNCAVPMGERVPFGQPGISPSACEKMGGCVDSFNSACYYPLDECTADQHFVFAIRYNSASIPVDPTKLVIPGSPNCKPVIVNDKVAIFNFKVTQCGTHYYEIGETKIYLAEVQTVVEALNLKYGVITRSNPLRFLVECRYSRSGSVQQSLVSAGYMVKMPASSLPSVVYSDGLYGVELRIAKDDSYSEFLPTNSLPLRLLLGTPVNLELRLLSPTPEAVILVNYCIAYPRSAKNALVLVYEGCVNPHDPNVFVLHMSDSTNRHQRRFMIKAFVFMEQKTNKYLDEEIIFMCSSEVCMPIERTCEERCFDGKVA